MSDDASRKAAETARVLRLARQAAIDEERAVKERPVPLDEYGPLGNAITEDELLRGYRGVRKEDEDDADR